MARFLGTHLFEYLGGSWIGLAQRIGKLSVNAPVLFLAGNRQGQNFAFSQILESLEHILLFRAKGTVEDGIKAALKSSTALYGKNACKEFPRPSVDRKSTRLNSSH